MKNEDVSFAGFLKDNRVLIIIIVVVMIFTFGYGIMTADDLSVDEEMAARLNIEDQTSIWYGFARYGIPVVYMTFFPSFATLPFFNMLLSVVTLGIGALMMCYFLFRMMSPIKVPKLAYYFFVSMMISYPANISFLDFNNINFPVSLGILITFVAAYSVLSWILDRKSIWLGVIGTVLFAFAISIYQSFVGVFLLSSAALWLGYIYRQSSFKKKIVFKQVLMILVKYLIVLGLSLGLFFAVNLLVQAVTGFGANGYTEGLMQMGSIKQVAFNLYYNLKRVFIDEGVRGGENILIVLILFLFTQARLLFKKGYRNKLLLSLLSIGLVLAPFALGIIFPGIMIRALTGLSAFIGLMGFFSVMSISVIVGERRIKKLDCRKAVFALLAALIVMICYLQVYSTNLRYYASHLRYQRDEAFAHMLATDIIDEIEDLEPDVPVTIIGEYEIAVAENVGADSFRASFFKYDQVPRRSVLFMQYLGYKFEMPSDDIIEKARDYATDMPVWPEEGSIEEHDDCIVVKLSEVK